VKETAVEHAKLACWTPAPGMRAGTPCCALRGGRQRLAWAEGEGSGQQAAAQPQSQLKKVEILI